LKSRTGQKTFHNQGAIEMSRWYTCLIGAALFAALFATSSWGGGLWMHEQAAPDMGLAAAGRAAAAKDASTAGGNPAGMTRLDRSELATGFLALFPNIKFDTDESSFGGGDGGNAGYFTPVTTLHYVHSVTSNFKLGVSAGSYFGLGLDYDDDWAGRYYFLEG
jgi:long-chain fatty acid transport protein